MQAFSLTQQPTNMIALSNGHQFEYMIASGAMAFDGRGWPWEKPLVGLGLIRPELFTTVVKTLTKEPRKGNLRWWKPWECVALIEGGAVNKVGLTNPGIDYWCEQIAPGVDFEEYCIVGSIFGDKEELVYCTHRMNRFPLRAIEVNFSCPNLGAGVSAVEALVDGVKTVERESDHPVIVKVSTAQDYLMIASELEGIAEAISINSVPWELVFRNQQSPLHKLERRVQGGGGGVSGKPAQSLNWKAVRELAEQGCLPVIGPSIMHACDLGHLKRLGAQAYSFGTIHLPTHPVWRHPFSVFTNPMKPTQIVQEHQS